MSTYSDFANNIARLTEARAAAIAEGQRENGRIWGGAIQNIGNLVANYPLQQAQLAEAKQRQQIGQLQLQQAQTAQQAQQRANQIIANLPKNPDGTYDAGSLMQQFAGANVPLEDQERYAKSLDGINQITRSFNQVKTDKVAEAADQFLSDHPKDAPITPEATHAWFAMMKDAGLQNDQDEQKFTALIGQGVDPRTLLQRVRGLGSKYQAAQAKLSEPMKVGPGEIVTTPERGAQGLPPLISAPAIQKTEAELAADAANPTSPTASQSKAALAQLQAPSLSNAQRAQDALAETQRHNREDERLSAKRIAAEGANNAPIDLTPAGLDAAAMNYMKTGQLPPLGMGDKVTRKAIINRAAELGAGAEPRTSLDLASNRAGFAADENSLKGLQKQRDAISAFENTALKNIDIFLNTAGKVVDTGSPLANAPARAISGKVLGSPDQAAYEAARQVALNEVAKITSNPNLSGQLSDAARKEVENFNAGSATLKQSVAVMRVLKQDMANRAAAYDTQIADIKGRISGKKAESAPAPSSAPSGGAPTYQDYLKSRGQK